MSLKEELLQDMKAAMKAKEAGKTALSVIRMVRSSIRNTEIDGKCELDDAGVGAVIAKEMKQRKESLAEFEKAGRQRCRRRGKSRKWPYWEVRPGKAPQPMKSTRSSTMPLPVRAEISRYGDILLKLVIAQGQKWADMACF